MRKLLVPVVAVAVLWLTACGGEEAEEPTAQSIEGIEAIENPLAWFECLASIDPSIDPRDDPELLRDQYPAQVEACNQANARDTGAEESAKNQFREEFEEQWLAGAYGEWDLPCADLHRTEGNVVHAMAMLEQRWREANPDERPWSYDRQGIVQAVIKRECESWTPPPPELGTFENPVSVGETRNIGRYEVAVTEFIRNATEEQVRAWDENVGLYASYDLPAGEHVLVTIEGVYRGPGQQEAWDDINIMVVDKGEVRYNGIFDAWSPLRIGEEFTATVHFHIEPSTAYDASAATVYLSPGPGDSDHDARVHWSD